jgi:isocitrate/isopropylmalate dehydrogenase
MMLEFLGWDSEAAALNSSVKAAVRENFVTPDLGGTHKTAEVGDWLTKFVSDRSNKPPREQSK